jgi:hypothetical protein
MNYPEKIEVDGIQFALDTDFRTAIRCFEIIEDDSVDDYERALAIIYLLLGDIPVNVDLRKVLKVLQKYLACGNDKNRPSEERKDMDFIQDEKYIVASFMSDYHIDLSSNESMHWWHFINLLNGLTEECVLNKVREVRTCDLKDFKGKQREKMAKAKRQLALKTKVSHEDEVVLARFNALFEPSSENQLDEGDSLMEEEEG